VSVDRFSLGIGSLYSKNSCKKYQFTLVVLLMLLLTMLVDKKRVLRWFFSALIDHLQMFLFKVFEEKLFVRALFFKTILLLFSSILLLFVFRQFRFAS
jgi:hypothetical protein